MVARQSRDFVAIRSLPHPLPQERERWYSTSAAAMLASAVLSTAAPERAPQQGADASALSSDRDLVLRAQALDEEALTEIFTTYHPRVLNYALSQLRDPQTAEDVASEVMLKVLEAIGRYRFNGVPFAAWVFRIARNALIDVRRRRSRYAGCSLPDGLASPGTDTATRVEEALDRDRLHEAMRGLREEHRHVLVLRFMEGLNTAEVAYILGRSQSSVKALQYRALNRLRRTMVRPLPETEASSPDSRSRPAQPAHQVA
jgi:RNA polymerase sigma-70 factor (ECF subfamily)